MAAPTLNTTARDALGLVAQHLLGMEVANVVNTSRAIHSAFTPTIKQNLALQKSQWELLLPGQLSNNYSQNEEILREFGLSTQIFTPEEQVAWQAAKQSLIAPPPVLTPEEEDALLAKHAPLYHQIIHSTSEQAGRKIDRHHCNHLRELISATYNPDIHYKEGDTFRTSSVTLAVLMEGSLLDFLTVFAVDGKRYLHPEAGYNLAESTGEYLRRGVDKKLNYNHYAMILSLVLSGSPRLPSYQPLYMAAYNRVAAQALSVTGYNFFSNQNGYPDRIYPFGGYDYMALGPILDRGLVQLGARAIPPRVLDYFERSSRVDRHFAAYLRDRMETDADLAVTLQSALPGK